MTESEILWENAKALKYNLTESFVFAGKQLAEELVKEFGKKKSYTIICGTGGNGGDGLSTAYFLYENGVKKIKTYLIGRGNQLKNKFVEPIWLEVQNFKEQLNLKQDCYASDIERSDVTIEALVGTGLEGKKLTKRYKDVIDRVSHFGKPTVAIDIACPHYEPSITYSIQYPKSINSKIINIKIPKNLEFYCGPGERKALWKPKKSSHKNRNGELLIITDQNIDKDLLKEVKNEYNTNINIFHFPKHESLKQEYKAVSSKRLNKIIEQSDAILISNVDENILSFATVRHILQAYSYKKFIFSAGILNFINLKDFQNLENKVIVLQNNNLPQLNKKELSIEGKLKRFAIENNCVVMFLGFNNILYNSDGQFRVVQSKQDFNKALLKTSVYSTKNDLWLSSRANFG